MVLLDKSKQTAVNGNSVSNVSVNLVTYISYFYQSHFKVFGHWNQAFDIMG